MADTLDKLGALESMLTIRRFEEAVVGLFLEHEFMTHFHLYIGQESTGVASHGGARARRQDRHPPPQPRPRARPRRGPEAGAGRDPRAARTASTAAPRAPCT